jgi:hypothetical protein
VRDDEPELARTMAASVMQYIAFGERAGQNVRRIGSGFGHAGEHPALTGIRCARVLHPSERLTSRCNLLQPAVHIQAARRVRRQRGALGGARV